MAGGPSQTCDFAGLEVVAFESRRAKEVAALIFKCGGNPRVIPLLREVPLEENSAAFEFAERLLAGKLDCIICMTGVGTAALIEILKTRYALEILVRAFSGVTVVARGPKPTKVLRDLNIPIAIMVPEPNTWREIVQELDGNSRGFNLSGARVAVQEYGVSNQAFLGALKERGAEVLPVPVYRWELPDDVGPVHAAIERIISGDARVLLFTSSAQVHHMLEIAANSGHRELLFTALRTCAVCSVGPMCTETLQEFGIAVDMTPSRPKLGPLVMEAAERAAAILARKQNPSP
jgi:uroporphyrinogen-III synthase